MQYLLIQFDNGDSAYQEVCNGSVTRYCDMDGNTVSDAGRGSVFIKYAEPPAWALPDPVVEEPGPVAPVERILSKIQFRRVFTDEERPLIDEFNATFETLPYLTAEQKRDIRSGLEDYKATGEVNMKDPSTARMLGLYVMVGHLTAERMQEILNA